MPGFERIENDAIYSDAVEALPIIISYGQQNIEWNDKHLTNTSSEKLIEDFSGKHECFFCK